MKETKKLYFEPESSSGKKRNKTNKEERIKLGKQKGKSFRFVILSLFLLFLAAVILIVIWLTGGSKTISGQYPENIKNEALVCDSKEISYPKISKADSDNKNLKINILFSNDNKLRNASLTYTLYYENENAVKRAEAFAHAEFNNSLYENGYPITKFNNKFARYSDSLIFSLYALSAEIDDYSAQYFMIEQEEYKLPETIQEYKKMYESQGFSCTSSEE